VIITKDNYIWYSNKLALTIEQGFKFLNTLSLSLKHKVVFFIRQGLKIADAVVVLDSIKMVHYPALRQWLFICLLPYKMMLKNISVSCPRVFRIMQIYISRFALKSATFPTTVLCPLDRIRCCKVNNITITASFGHSGISPTYLLATINTPIFSFIFRWSVIFVDIKLVQCAGFTSRNSMVAQFTTIKAGMAMPHTISLGGFRFFCHTYSIPYYGG